MKQLLVIGTILICLYRDTCGWSTKEEEPDDFCMENGTLMFNFSDTVITKLGSNFIASSDVTCLNFRRNSIKSIQNAAFNQTPNLRYLDLSENRINPTLLFSFGELPKVEMIRLNNQAGTGCCYDTAVSVTYPNLRYLDVSMNNIREIQNMIWEPVFSNLIYLDLSYNAISTTTFINKLSERLTHLYLHNNKINEIRFNKLHDLVELTLDDNSISSLDYAVFEDLKSLKNLSMAENKIKSIPFDLFLGVMNLEYLNMSNNQMSTINDGSFYNLKSLQTLILDQNQLSSVPFMTMQVNISYLSINCNNIQSLSPETFHNLPYLKKLFLNSNQISNIETYTFESQEMLEELHLADNKLTTLPLNWWKYLKNLQYLDLSDNKFKTLESLSLSATLPFRYLYVRSLSLDFLTANSFDTIPKNITIDFRNVPDETLAYRNCRDYRKRQYYYG